MRQRAARGAAFKCVDTPAFGSLRPRSQVHDIEDLVRAGTRRKACPYFTARALAVDADLVFCPYNYLVDPVIRASMDIQLRGCVLVFDEAHNIEDVAREAAGVDISLAMLQQVQGFGEVGGEESGVSGCRRCD